MSSDDKMIKLPKIPLALDMAAWTGWAHANGNCGLWDLRVKTDESSGIRFLKLDAKLQNCLSTTPFDIVVFEAVRHKSHGTQTRAIITGSGFQAVMMSFCDKRSIDYVPVSSTAAKKHATGNGHASKQAMVAAAKKQWPEKEIADDNVADALWILDYYKTIYQGDEDGVRNEAG